MNEHTLISKYLSILSKNNPSSKNLNDDVFFDKSKGLAISVDTYNEGVHFINFDNPEMILRKVIRSSISDLICKGVKPKYYFLSASGSKNLFNKKKILKIVKTLKSEQKKFNIKISGGDTCNSKIVSFTLISLGYAKHIVERNNSKDRDDIYVTGNIGDSFVGLKILKKVYKSNKLQKKYFVNKYYCPEIPYNYYKVVQKFANSSIDVSDGLFDDLQKLINKQKVGCKVYVDKIPISNNLKSYLKTTRKKKIDQIYHGDDYQIIFTAPKFFRSRIISLSKKMNQKITLIGMISAKLSSINIVNGKKVIKLGKFKGYSHTL